MEVLFLGVGEAADPNLPNTSIIIKNDLGEAEVLLDCGFTTPHLFFQGINDPLKLQTIWISHFHGDHFFGIPLLLLKFWELGRREPLTIAGPQGVKSKISMIMDMAYPGCSSKFSFSLNYMELAPRQSEKIGKYKISTAKMLHSQMALAIKLEYKEKSVFYSGDGTFSDEAINLAAECDLLINESFRVEGETAGHSNIHNNIQIALASKCTRMALVHISENDRRNLMSRAHELILKSFLKNVIIPEQGHRLKI